jgi:hypothetical protein
MGHAQPRFCAEAMREYHYSKGFGAACILVVVVTLTGCGTSQPIDRWQKGLTNFTVKQGHGDPTILRESAELRSPDSARPGQIRFSEIDIPGVGLRPFTTMRDVHGVLLGQEGGTFFFLLGVVSRPPNGPARVEDVRIAACHLLGTKHECRFSPPDPQALNRYLNQDDSLAGDRVERHPVHRTFPLLDDDFRLDVADGVVTVTESHCRAVWRLRTDAPTHGEAITDIPSGL